MRDYLPQARRKVEEGYQEADNFRGDHMECLDKTLLKIKQKSMDK